jgi:hypothetical protein
MIVTAILLPLSIRSGLSVSVLMSQFGTTCPGTLSDPKWSMTSFVGFFVVISMIYTRIARLAVFVLSQGMSDGGLRERTAGQ